MVPVGRRRHCRCYVAHGAWIVGITIAVVYRVARFGFNPTDQGFVLAQSWRLLHGEIPHVDIVSARPLGTPIVHMLDFLLPGPRYLSSITLAALEMVCTALACAALVTGSVRSWGLPRTGAVIASALVDIGINPVMPWHTVDGALFTACGWWAVDRGLATDRPRLRRTGLFVLGVAVCCKQSFAPVALIGVIMLLARGRGRSAAATALDLLVLGAFPAGYLGVVVAAGGWHDAVGQMLGATPVYDRRLISVLSAHRWSLLDIGVVVVVLAATRYYRRLRWLDAVGSLVILAVVGHELVTGRLVVAADWTIMLWWIALFVTVVDAAARRCVPWRPLAVVVLAALVSLSWGADSPTLLAGTLAFTTCYVVVAGHRDVFGLPRLRVVTSASAVLLVVGAWLGVTTAHDRGPYRDAPQSGLTVDLGGAIPDLAGIRTNASTAKYVGQLAACIRAHPAANVAVFPDDPFVYPLMRLHDPFPLDWPLPLEMVGDARQRMMATVDRLDRDGHYLVLFQTVDSLAIGRRSTVPDTVAPTGPIVVESGIEPAILDGLTGRRITCGSLVGVYRR